MPLGIHIFWNFNLKKNLKRFEYCKCKRVGISTTSVTSQHCIFSPNKVNKIKEYCLLPFNHVWCLPWLPILLTSSSCLVCPQLCISVEQCQLNWIKIHLTSKVVFQLINENSYSLHMNTDYFIFQLCLHPGLKIWIFRCKLNQFFFPIYYLKNSEQDRKSFKNN